MPLPDGSVPQLNRIRDALLYIINYIDGYDHDFNQTPTHGIVPRLTKLLRKPRAANDDLANHLIWISYHLGMIAFTDHGNYTYGPTPQPPGDGSKGSPQYWLYQIVVTLNVLAPKFGGNAPGSASTDPVLKLLTDIADSVESMKPHFPPPTILISKRARSKTSKRVRINAPGKG